MEGTIAAVVGLVMTLVLIVQGLLKKFVFARKQEAEQCQFNCDVRENIKAVLENARDARAGEEKTRETVNELLISNARLIEKMEGLADLVRQLLLMRSKK